MLGRERERDGGLRGIGFLSGLGLERATGGPAATVGLNCPSPQCHCPQLTPCLPTQHGTLGSGRSSDKGPSWSSRSLGARCRNSIASCPEEQPHVGNYRLLRTIGKGNFAKVKLARHILTGREVSEGAARGSRPNPAAPVLCRRWDEVRLGPHFTL